MNAMLCTNHCYVVGRDDAKVNVLMMGIGMDCGWVCECFDDVCEDSHHSVDLVVSTAQPTIDRIVLCGIVRLL